MLAWWNSLTDKEIPFYRHALAHYEKAIDYYEQALATLVQILGDDHPSTQTVRANLEKTRAGMAGAKGECWICLSDMRKRQKGR